MNLKITDKINSLRPLDIAVFVLAFSISLTFLKPALVFLTDKTPLGTEFYADYGIPSNWTSTAPGRISHDIVPNGSIGLDFLCPDTYIRCAGASVDIYNKFCPGDPYLRIYGYPPLMTYLMLWIPIFSIQQNIALWTMLILLSVFLTAFFLLKIFWKLFQAPGKRDPLNFFIPAALFTLSYPSLFAYERGNNDLWVLWLLFAGVYAILKDEWFLLGTTLSASTLLKIFPISLWGAVFIAGVLLTGAGILQKDRTRRDRGLSMLAGEITGAALILLTLWRDHLYYFKERLPILTRSLSKQIYTGDRVINHSLKMGFEEPGLCLGVVLWVAATAALAVFLYRLRENPKETAALKQKCLFSFTYLALLMTYLPNINSFDYNLILGLPFFCLICVWQNTRRKHLINTAFFVWLLGISLPRWSNAVFFPGLPGSGSVYLLLQSAGLALFAAAQILMIFDPL